MWILSGRERVEVVVERLNQSRWRCDDVNVGNREVLNLRILKRYFFAVAERENNIRAHLLHGGRNISDGLEARTIDLQNVTTSTGLKIGDDVVSIPGLDNKRIATGSAGEHVIALAAVDHVVAGIADDDVVEIVTGGRGAISVAQRKIFDIGRIDEAVAVNHAVVDRVNTLVGEFDHPRAVIVHKVRIVACTADQA